MTFVWVVVVILVLAVVIIGGTARKRSVLNAESGVMREVASRYGWRYIGGEPRWVNVLSGTPPAAPMRIARTGTVLNVIEAQVDGASVTFFHLLARNNVTGHGMVGIAAQAATENPTEHTYCVLALPGRGVPLTVCPPGDWAARRVRPSDLTNLCRTGDPAFDQQFVLTSPFPVDAAHALTPELRQFLATTWTPFAVGETGHLLTWRAGRMTDGEHLVHQARSLVYIARALSASIRT